MSAADPLSALRIPGTPGIPGAPEVLGGARRAGAERSRRGGGRHGRLDPLLRNGHALIASSVLSSAIGLGFWLLAARRYSPGAFGRNSVALSSLGLIGGVAQANLANALVRFLQPAGNKARRYVIYCYALSLALACVLSVGFALVVPVVVPGLAFIVKSPEMWCWWVMSCALWAIFVLEDGVLTGLRRARIVPVENSSFALVKLVLLLPFATLFAGSGIYLSWTIALATTVLVTNLYLFLRALPRYLESATTSTIGPGELVAYVPFDSAAALCWIITISVPPLVVLDQLGPDRAGYFNLVWTMSYTLYLFAIAIGSSFVVELSRDGDHLAAESLRVLVHLLKILVPLALAAVVFSHVVLEVFGGAYTHEDPVVLDLLVVSALPFAVVWTAVNVLRVLRRTREVFVLHVLMLVLVVGGVLATTARFHLVATAACFLGAQLVAAGVVVVRRQKIWPARTSREVSAVVAARSRATFAPVACLGLSVLRGLGFWRVPVVRRPSWSRRTERVHSDKDLLMSTGYELRLLFPDKLAPPAKPGVRRLVGGSDLDVLSVTSSDGTPRAVVKLPRTERGVEDLFTEQRVLEHLRSIDALAAFAELLPSPVLCRSSGRSYSVEAYLPGENGAELAMRSASVVGLATANALSAIGELHRSSGAGMIDEPAVSAMLAGPLSWLRTTHPSGAPPRSQLDALDAVEELVMGALCGAGEQLCLVHGDYTPGNVLFDGQRRVLAIVDWCQAHLGLAAADATMWLVSFAALNKRHQFGREVTELLGERPRAAMLRLRAAGAAGNVAPEALVVLAWLNHVANNLAKSSRYGRQITWWSANVEPVLRHFAPS